MTASILDTILGIRHAVFTRRLSGGSNNIKWSTKHEALIRQHVWDLPEKLLLGVAEVKLFDSQHPVAAPSSTMEAHVLRSMNSSALSWQVQISNGSTDLMLDQIAPNSWNLQNVGNNCPVLLAHDSSTLPVGQSSMPWLRGGTALMANLAFPQPGISAVSDQVRAMVAAGVLRGASVGFIPGQFKFSKDPARPLGIDFLSGHTLTEWSLCAVPCNPSCLVVGPTSSGKSASDVKITDRRREARALAARARAISESIPDPVPTTREQRIAEASAFRRAAMAGLK
jgi:phage head maturation protease